MNELYFLAVIGKFDPFGPLILLSIVALVDRVFGSLTYGWMMECNSLSLLPDLEFVGIYICKSC